jgi:putative flavoprotein involved in K+ transport
MGPSARRAAHPPAPTVKEVGEMEAIMSNAYVLQQHEPAVSGGVEHFGTVAIGAGQTGLAVGYHLARRGQAYVILDENQRVGNGWRRRYDSLRLYTPAKYDGLPGDRFPAAPYEFPTGKQLVDYLEGYAAEHRLPVRPRVFVDSVRQTTEGFVVSAGDQRFEAAQVVVATGARRLPLHPCRLRGGRTGCR